MEHEPAHAVPDACTLPTAEQPMRLLELDSLFGAALHAERISPTVLEVVLAGDAALLGSARDLLRRESECCSFFTFTLHPVVDGETRLRVEVPSQQTAVLDAITDRI